MTVDDGTTRYGMVIMETTPDFTRMYPLGDKAVPVEEILAQVELEFLSSKEEAFRTALDNLATGITHQP